MDFAAMTREQTALLVALVVVFFVIPLGWLIHEILKYRRAVAVPANSGPAVENIPQATVDALLASVSTTVFLNNDIRPVNTRKVDK